MQLSKTYTKTAESFELKNQGRNYITNSKQKNKVLAFFKKVLVDVLSAGILKNCSVSIFFLNEIALTSPEQFVFHFFLL